MSLIQSAKLYGHDPYECLKDILTRLPTQPNSRIDELLPYNWKPEAPTPAGAKASQQKLTDLEHVPG